MASTLHLGLLIAPRGGASIHAAVDASWANHADGRSHGGHVVYFAESPIAFHSSVIDLICESSTKAELCQMSTALDDVEQARDLAQAMGMTVPTSVIDEDNSPALTTAKNGFGQVARTRPMAVRLARIKEQERSMNVDFRKIDTADNDADILTKVIVSPSEFAQKRERLHVVDVERVQSTGELPLGIAGRGGVLEKRAGRHSRTAPATG
jgi:hypothetical protein